MRYPQSRVSALLLLLPGFCVVAFLPVLRPSVPLGASVTVVVLATLGGLGATQLRDQPTGRDLLGLLAASSILTYVCVPDTDLALLLIGMVVPAALVGLSTSRASGFGVCPWIVIYAYVALVEGRGRPGSIVGAMGCLGVLLVLPVVLRLRVDALPAARGVRVTLAGMHVAMALVAARIAGLRARPGGAALILVATLLLGAMALRVLLATRTDTRRPRKPLGSAPAQLGDAP